MLAALTWIMLNGALTLPGTDVAIWQRVGDPMPYILFCPGTPLLGYYSLDSAKMDGERCARMQSPPDIST